MIKRFLLFACLIVATICGFAATQKEASSTAVTMQSYEQTWHDSEATISLKNNTDSTLRTIKFRLLYFNMKGQQEDYRDFSVQSDIEPGLTRKVEIPAYCHDNNYYYYRTPDGSIGTPFKVEFKFHEASGSIDKNADNESESSSFAGVIMLICSLGVLIAIGVVALKLINAIIWRLRH